MGCNLNKFRKKLKNIENIEKEFPCPKDKFSDLFEVEVFHFEKWSNEFDKIQRKASSPKIDIVIEFPDSLNPKYLLVIEYKEPPIINRGNKPRRLLDRTGEIDYELLEKLAQDYCKRILKKFKAFCSEFSEIWKNPCRIDCYFLLSIPKERYKEFFRKINPFPVIELGIDEGMHDYIFRAKFISAIENFKERTKMKLLNRKEEMLCCNNFTVDDCEELEKRISVLKE